MDGRLLLSTIMNKSEVFSVDQIAEKLAWITRSKVERVIVNGNWEFIYTKKTVLKNGQIHNTQKRISRIAAIKKINSQLPSFKVFLNGMSCGHIRYATSADYIAKKFDLLVKLSGNEVHLFQKDDRFSKEKIDRELTYLAY
jgi:hypothetical protein